MLFMVCDRGMAAGLALAAALAAGAASAQQKGAPAPDEVVRLTTGLVNEFRRQEGRRAVVPDARLTDAARQLAAHMADTGRFGHDADGSTPAERTRRHGYEHCIVSENIAYRYSSAGFAARELAEGFLEGWKRSPGHRRNMLEPDVTETGMAVARSARGYYYAVQVFGRPLSQEITFSVSNRSGVTIRYRLGGKTLPLAPRQTRTHRQCRTEALRIALPDGEDATVTPGNGDRLAIVPSRTGELGLRTE